MLKVKGHEKRSSMSLSDLGSDRGLLLYVQRKIENLAVEM